MRESWERGDEDVGERNCWANSLITPRMREAMRSMSFWLEVCFDFISTALLLTTVSMARRPAARIVSPDSVQREHL